MMKIKTKLAQILTFSLVFMSFSTLFAQQNPKSETENLAKAWFDEAMLETDNVRKIEAYDNVIRLNPNLTDAYNNRGVAKKHLGRFSEAIADYDLAIAQKSDFAVAYFNRGDAKKALGQYANAIEDFDKTIQLRPDLPQPYGNKGCTLVALGKYAEALIWLNKCLAIDENAIFAKNCRKEAINARKKIKN